MSGSDCSCLCTDAGEGVRRHAGTVHLTDGDGADLKGVEPREVEFLSVVEHGRISFHVVSPGSLEYHFKKPFSKKSVAVYWTIYHGGLPVHSPQFGAYAFRGERLTVQFPGRCPTCRRPW